MKYRRLLVTLAAVAVVAAVIVADATTAGAWPDPDVEAAVASCPARDVTVTMTNRETGNPGSPGHGKVLSVYPGFPTTAFDPVVMPNTGTATSSITTTVPADFTGRIHYELEIHWFGSDGADSRPVSLDVEVAPCPVVTTTTTSTSSTTSSTSTTTTTTPPSTTTTTAPVTTTTSTTSTTGPTTSTTTSTTTPSTTTTTAAPPPSLIPPASIEPATPVVAAPVFTG